MAGYGVTPVGFVPEPLTQSQQDIFAALQAAFGTDIDPTPNGPFGLLAALMAGRESPLWQMGKAVYDAAYPDSANDAQLDDVGSITGCVRLPALKSTVNEVLIGTNGTFVPSGTVFATSTSGVQFLTLLDNVIATLAAYATGQAVAVGVLVTNGGNIYACVDSITSTTTAPTGTGLNITDSDGVWRFCGVGTAAVVASCSSSITGPIAAPSGTLTLISTPVSGLSIAFNPLDAVQGRNIESNPAYRLRRNQLLQAEGSSPVAAIRAALLKTAGVTGALVFENPTDVIDGAGRAPHSVECVVTGGTDLDVSTTIWSSKSAGVGTSGSSTATVVDPSTSVSYPIKFTRPTSISIYVIVNLLKGATWPANGVALAQAAIIAWSNGLDPALGETAFAPGQSVFASPIGATLLDQMPGTQINDITSVFIGTAPSPGTNTPLAMSFAQIAAFDTSRITINAT